MFGMNDVGVKRDPSELPRPDNTEFVFEKKIGAFEDALKSKKEGVPGNINHYFHPDGVQQEEIRKIIKVMMSEGTVYNDSPLSRLDLETICKWKVNPDYVVQNVRQHAGFAAEVLGTAKENIRALFDGTGTKVFRADDRPDLFKKNDQFVDKIRVNREGEIIDRIQVKFVGKDAKSCLEKLASPQYDKYFVEGRVDKVEIPSDYYDTMMAENMIDNKIASLTRQYDRVSNMPGKEEAAQNIKNRIERYKQIREKLERSTVSSDEAVTAATDPSSIARTLEGKVLLENSIRAGLETGALAAGLEAVVAVTDDIGKIISGELKPKEAAVDVAKKTAVAGGVGGISGFASTAASQVLKESGHSMLQALGDANVPAAVISFGIESYDTVSSFVKGETDGKKMAYDLGNNAAKVSGGFLGGAAAGAAIGSVLPGAGNIIGGIVGGMIGTAVSAEVYKEIVEACGSEKAKEIGNTIKDQMGRVYEGAKALGEEMADVVKGSMHTFAQKNDLPFSI